MRSARALDDYGPEFRYGHYLVTGGLGKLIGGAAGVEQKFAVTDNRF